MQKDRWHSFNALREYLAMCVSTTSREGPTGIEQVEAGILLNILQHTG